jgi:hypothetical protein
VVSLEELLAKAANLDEAQVQLLSEMADAFCWEVTAWLNPDSDLVADGFGDSILNRLRLHHATSEQKFNKTSFEFAFTAAARYAGRRAAKTVAHTFSGADVVVDGVRWSLKTEGATNMSPTTITISKFCEARWIRDCIDEDDFARETTARILRHLSEYDRVVTLRGTYIDDGAAVQYDLVEIPHDMLMAVQDLTPDDFSPRTAAGSSTARVYYKGTEAFVIVLDGSVEKITLRNIKVSKCITHATWVVPVLVQTVD